MTPQCYVLAGVVESMTMMLCIVAAGSSPGEVSNTAAESGDDAGPAEYQGRRGRTTGTYPA